MGRRHARLLIALLPIALALASVAGCAHVQAQAAYPGYATPQDSLRTFFASAQRHDYATTYSCYYQRYRERVTEQEFIKHRNQASELRGFTLGPVLVNQDSATATATLEFAVKAANGSTTRTIQVREDLVREAGGWKIRVW